MMDNYVSRACQTDIQGLCHDPAAVPLPLVAPPPANNTAAAKNITGTPTPPDDMALDTARLLAHELEVTSSTEPVLQQNPSHTAQTEQSSYAQSYNYATSTLQPSMLLKRKNRCPRPAPP